MLSHVVLLLALVLQGVKSNDGSTVHGRVKLLTGKVVPNIFIALIPVSPGASPTTQTKADEQGAFSMTGLLPGVYAIYPYSLDGVYPIRTGTFLSAQAEHVTVAGAEGAVEKDLVLPEPVGAVEGLVLRGAAPAGSEPVVLCHTGEPRRSAAITTDKQGRFRYLVPSGEPIEILAGSAIARGNQVSALTLKPGEVRSVKIDLSLSGAGRSPTCIPFGR